MVIILICLLKAHLIALQKNHLKQLNSQPSVNNSPLKILVRLKNFPPPRDRSCKLLYLLGLVL